MRKCCLLDAICSCVFSTPNDRCQADVVFTTDLSTWQSANPGFDDFVFDSTNVGLAEEVAAPPGFNENVGPVLTFQSAATLLSFDFSFQTLELGADFTFDDNEGGSVFDNVLSVGDINNFEDDDFRIDFSGSDVFGFGFELLDNGTVTGESFSVFGASGLLGTLSTIPGSSGVVFIGATSDEAITHVIFDEDSGGDDIAVRSIFASTSAVPEPNSGIVVGLGMLLFTFRSRKKSS